MAATRSPHIRHHITQIDTTVSDCLQKHFRLTPEQSADLIRLGALYSNKLRILDNALLKKGTYIRIHLHPKRFDLAGIDWKASVVHTDPDFLVVNKPAGIPVHASLDNQVENVLHQLREQLDTPLFVTQRLDAPVSGLMVIARTPYFQKVFNQWLADRKVGKVYRALTETPPPLGLLVHYMEPSERSPRRVALDAVKGLARCELQVDSVAKQGDFYESEIQLLTGRTHQIRAQMAAIGCSILGDKMYRSRKKYLPHQIALASIRVDFPVHGKTRFEIDPRWF